MFITNMCFNLARVYQASVYDVPEELEEVRENCNKLVKDVQSSIAQSKSKRERSTTG